MQSHFPYHEEGIKSLLLRKCYLLSGMLRMMWQSFWHRSSPVLGISVLGCQAPANLHVHSDFFWLFPLYISSPSSEFSSFLLISPRFSTSALLDLNAQQFRSLWRNLLYQLLEGRALNCDLCSNSYTV